LVLLRAAQALLYLVPCTLGVVLLLAVARGELPLLLDAVLDPQDDTLEVDATDGAGEPHDSAGNGGADQRVALLAAQQGARSSSGGGDQVHHTLRV
jgi:hypothetical protein